MELEFYSQEEIREMKKANVDLYYVDDGIDEAIIRFEDIPDFIVWYSEEIGISDLKFYKVGKDVYEPDITTIGVFLNKIKPELREKIIDRLVALQTSEEEPKKFKIIDEDMFAKIK